MNAGDSSKSADLAKIVRDNIARLMATHGIANDTELGRISGVPQPTIYRLMSGKQESVKFSTLAKIAWGLRVTPGDLMRPDGVNEYASRAAVIMDNVHPDFRPTLLTMMESLMPAGDPPPTEK